MDEPDESAPTDEPAAASNPAAADDDDATSAATDTDDASSTARDDDDATSAATDTDDASPTTTEVPDVEELVGPRRTLEPEIQAVWLLKSGATAVVLGLVSTVAFSFLTPVGAWVGGVVFVVALLLGVVHSVLRYRSWSYEVREDSLYLERGVLTHVTTVVPYVRIQHVDASRGPIERTFGLATTVVYTAGSRGADVSIPGLTPERAADLQTRLKQLAIAAEGEDAV